MIGYFESREAFRMGRLPDPDATRGRFPRREHFAQMSGAI